MRRTSIGCRNDDDVQSDWAAVLQQYGRLLITGIVVVTFISKYRGRGRPRTGCPRAILLVKQDSKTSQFPPYTAKDESDGNNGNTPGEPRATTGESQWQITLTSRTWSSGKLTRRWVKAGRASDATRGIIVRGSGRKAALREITNSKRRTRGSGRIGRDPGGGSLHPMSRNTTVSSKGDDVNSSNSAENRDATESRMAEESVEVGRYEFGGEGIIHKANDSENDKHNFGGKRRERPLVTSAKRIHAQDVASVTVTGSSCASSSLPNMNAYASAQTMLQQTTLLLWITRTPKMRRIKAVKTGDEKGQHEKLYQVLVLTMVDPVIIRTDLDVLPNELLFKIFCALIFWSPTLSYKERAKQKTVLREASTGWYRYIQAEPRFWVHALVGDTDEEWIETYAERSNGCNLNVCFQWQYDKEAPSTPTPDGSATESAKGSEAESEETENSIAEEEKRINTGYDDWRRENLCWGQNDSSDDDDGYSSRQGNWLMENVPEQVMDVDCYVQRASTLVIDTDYSEALVAIRTTSQQMNANALRRLCIRLAYRELDVDGELEEHPLDAIPWFTPAVWDKIQDLHITNIALPFRSMHAQQLRTLHMFGTGNWSLMDIEAYTSVIENAPNLHHLTLANMRCAHLTEESAPRNIHSALMRSLQLKQAGNASMGILATRLRFTQLESMRVQVASNIDSEDLARSEYILARTKRLQIDGLGLYLFDCRAAYRACSSVEDLSLNGSAQLFTDLMAESKRTDSGEGTSTMPKLTTLSVGKIPLRVVKEYIQMHDDQKRFTTIRIQRRRPGGRIFETWNENFKWIASRTNKLTMHDQMFSADMEYENARDWSQESIYGLERSGKERPRPIQVMHNTGDNPLEEQMRTAPDSMSSLGQRIGTRQRYQTQPSETEGNKGSEKERGRVRKRTRQQEARAPSRVRTLEAKRDTRRDKVSRSREDRSEELRIDSISGKPEGRTPKWVGGGGPKGGSSETVGPGGEDGSDKAEATTPERARSKGVGKQVPSVLEGKGGALRATGTMVLTDGGTGTSKKVQRKADRLEKAYPVEERWMQLKREQQGGYQRKREEQKKAVLGVAAEFGEGIEQCQIRIETSNDRPWCGRKGRHPGQDTEPCAKYTQHNLENQKHGGKAGTGGDKASIAKGGD
ncbi:hypothetical protein DFH06DRAFT_1143422 [Mycena polygramma]|nr:hypothetical protein DFH06DRAFT_1145906 [Mycena polygramma]KAJ7622017.1 hypothetical protein DFH06DRAFT_1143422 [Mycena polygramma]